MSIATNPNVKRPIIPVFIATTVMLSFISFWRVAAVVLADLASSAYYVGGDAEKVIGKSAPWFILAVMLFSYAVRAVYIESSAMFVRGGVYRVVKRSLGAPLAKLSVSALLFDYILTGPISAVSAGQYLGGFIEEVSVYSGHALKFDENHFAALFAVVVCAYFWWKNIQGMHESSEKAMQIMKITTLMVAILIVWSVITIIVRDSHLPPLPSANNFKFDHEAWGWLHGTWAQQLTWVIFLVGLGHSVLAMSGEETLAQVNREIESPKLKNLQRAGMVIFLYSLLFTGLTSFFGAMIIPDDVRPSFFANLIGGIEAKEIFDTYEQELFSRVVAVAEKEGKPVSLLVVPGANVFDAILLTAQRLESSKIVCGSSTKLIADEQAKLTGDAWERLPEPKPRLLLEIVAPDGSRKEYLLGPHTPRLREEDLALLHQLWLQITTDPRYSGLHHYDVVGLALKELKRELTGPERERLMALLQEELNDRVNGSSRN